MSRKSTTGDGGQLDLETKRLFPFPIEPCTIGVSGLIVADSPSQHITGLLFVA